jgi:hypothetical protein
MPIILLLMLLMGPRLVIFLTWLFTNYFGRAYDSNFWAFLGFLFMPYTMLGYAIAVNNLGGVDGGFGLAAVVFGVLLDLGVIGRGASHRRTPRGPGSFDANGLKRVN